MDQCLAAGGLDLARDGIRFGTVAARIDDDGCAAFRQRQCNGAADIAPCAGDDCDLAAEFVVRHYRPLRVMPGLVRLVAGTPAPPLSRRPGRPRTAPPCPDFISPTTHVA